MRPLLYALSLLLCCISPAIGQNGLPSVAGARGLALGGSGLTFEDVHAAWSNPAGLGQLTQSGFALYGEQRFQLAEIRQFGAVGAIQTGSGAFALNLGYYGFSEYNEQRLGLAYGRSLSSNFRIGLQVFALNTRIPEYGNKTNLSFELGLQGNISRQLSLGARIHSPVRMELVENEYLAAALAFGIGYRPSQKVFLTTEIEKDLEFPARVRAGIEYFLIDALVLRFGLSTAPSSLSFGVGYSLNENWRLDLAAAYHEFLGFTPGFSVVAQL